MHEPPPLWLRVLPLALALLLLVEAAGGSLAVIRLRHEEGRLAASATSLRQNLSDAGRRLNELGAQVAQAQEPESLRVRVGNRLAPAHERQIVWVRSSTAPRPDLAPPAILSLQLAYLEPTATSAPTR